MSIETGLVSRLNADAPFVALFGSRVYPAKRPQEIKTLPAARYFNVRDEPVMAIDGMTGVRTAVLELNLYTKDFDEGVSLREAAYTAIDGGNFGHDTWDDTKVQAAAMTTRYFYVLPEDGSDNGTHRHVIDINIQYEG